MNGRHSYSHSYSIITGDQLRDIGSIDASVSSCLSILDGSRRYSVGAWADVNSRLNLESSEECESIFMSLYETWAGTNALSFPSLSYSLDEKALAASTLGDSRGMFVDVFDIPASSDLPGFIRQRVDFDIEFDDSAELILADLEISDTDSQDDLACKLAVLRSYTERMHLRESVKKFAANNGIISYQDQANAHRCRTAEESDIRGKLRPVQRFFPSRNKFDEFVQMTLYEQRLQARLKSLEHQRSGISGGNETDVAMKANLPGEGDPEESRPTTRSRAGAEVRRGNRVLEEDCNKIRELLNTSATTETLVSTLSAKEQEILAQIGIPVEAFAIIRTAELARSEEHGCSAAEVVVTKHGGTFSVEARN